MLNGSRTPDTLRSMLGPRFWGVAVMVAALLAVGVSAVLIDLNFVEAFYRYTRRHEAWNLDELAMAAIATLVSLALTGSVVVVLLVRGLLRNESDRKAADLRMLQSQQMAALGTMVAGTAHSINNHLTPVIALADQIRSELAPTSPHVRDLEQILAAARGAADIVARMKTFARTNHTVEGMCAVEAVTRQAVRLAHSVAPPSARMTVSIASMPVHIGVSATAWEIVVLNLVNNAIDALEDMPGTIDIQLDLVHHAAVAEHQPGSRSGAWVRLQVADSGKGMTDEEMQRIFEPFFTTKPPGKGTGLGMPESHGIVDKAGGMIELTSKLGQGTHIEVWLPTVHGPDPTDS